MFSHSLVLDGPNVIILEKWKAVYRNSAFQQYYHGEKLAVNTIEMVADAKYRMLHTLPQIACHSHENNQILTDRIISRR